MSESHVDKLEALSEEIGQFCRSHFNWHFDSGVRWDDRNRAYAWWYGGHAGKMDVEVRAYSRKWVRVMKVAGRWHPSEVFKGEGALEQALAWICTN